MDKVKAFYSSNLPWKVISIILGFLFWIIGININNPTITQVVDVDLKLLNTEKIDNTGLILLNQEELDSVRVRVNVKGTRVDIENLNNQEGVISANIDFNPINVTNPDYVGEDVSLMINIENKDENIKILDFSPQIVNLEFDNNISKTLKVTPILNGADKNIYITDDEPEVIPKEIIVTGPETVINTIDSITATLDVSNATESFTKNVDVKVIDINNRNITNEFELSKDKVDVSVEINKGSIVTVLDPTIIGEPKENVEIASVTYTPQSIKVVGDEVNIQNLDYIMIDPIDVTDIEETTEYTFDVRNILRASNLSVEEGTPYEVTINVEVIRLGAVTYRYYVDDILIQGMKENITGPSYLDVTFVGKEEIIEDLNKEDIILSLDLRSIEQGINTVSIGTTLPEGVKLLNDEEPTVEFYYALEDVEETTDEE